MDRVRRVWSGLAREQRVAALAAVVLLATLFLPWYEKSYYDVENRAYAKDTLTGFGSADFVMASVVLVALGVLGLLWARGEDRGFHLPFGDGIVIMVAGGWAAVLIFYRVLDHPDVSGRGATIGIQWGVFIAFLAAAFLIYAGYRIHAAHRAEPPLPDDVERGEDATGATIAVDPPQPPERRPRRRGERPRRDVPTEVPPPPPPADDEPNPTARRRRAGGKAPDDDRPMPGQMSFDEADSEAETRRLPDGR